MGPDEGELRAALITNLDCSFENLVAGYWHQLYAFVLRRITNSQDAEDIVSETFVRSYVALKGYPAERIRTLKIRPWLYKITYNEYCRYLGRPAYPSLSSSPYPQERIILEEEDESKQPDLLFESVERRQELEGLVATLPEHYREAVSLYYFEEFSYQEIADLLEKPIGTVKSYVHRGIRQLRKVMATQSNEVY